MQKKIHLTLALVEQRVKEEEGNDIRVAGVHRSGIRTTLITGEKNASVCV